MSSSLPIRACVLRHQRPHISQATRAFSTIPCRHAPSFLDLQARAVSRENGHFSKLSGHNFVEHSPSLALLRAERDLAEGKFKKEEPDGILLNKTPKSQREAIVEEAYRAQIETLQAALAAKERSWRERYHTERKGWEDFEEKSLRQRLMFFVSLVFLGLLAADSIALADDVEEHCPGCFKGNTGKQLFVVGYLKSATEAATRWWNRSETEVKKPVKKAVIEAKKEVQEKIKQVKPVQQERKAKTVEEPLPYGWEKMKTPDGREYFANHVERYTTWLDPRKAQKSNLKAPNNVSDGSSILNRLMWAR